MAASAEADGQYLPSVIGDVRLFKRNLLASIPKPKYADYMLTALYGCALRACDVNDLSVMRGAWDCHYDALPAWVAL